MKINEGRGMRARDILKQAATRAQLRTLARDIGHDDAGENETVDQYNDRVGPVGSARRKAHKKKWAETQVKKDEGTSIAEEEKKTPLERHAARKGSYGPGDKLGASRSTWVPTDDEKEEIEAMIEKIKAEKEAKKEGEGEGKRSVGPGVNLTPRGSVKARAGRGPRSESTEYKEHSVYEIAARASSIVRGDRPKAAPYKRPSPGTPVEGDAPKPPLKTRGVSAASLQRASARKRRKVGGLKEGVIKKIIGAVSRWRNRDPAPMSDEELAKSAAQEPERTRKRLEAEKAAGERGKRYDKHPEERPKRDIAHTEHEGPSLAEDSKKGYPGIKGGTKEAKKEMKRRQKPKLPKGKKSRPSVIRREKKSKIPKATQF